MSWQVILIVACAQLQVFYTDVEGATPSVAGCPRYVEEGGTLTCTCTKGDCTSSDVTLSWPDHDPASPTLVQTDVQRQDSGSNFTCQMVCGGETSTVTYTLQVGYGPSADSLSILGNTTLIADGTRPLNLTCLATDVNPAPSYAWLDSVCRDHYQGSTCSVIPQRSQDGTIVRCRATDRFRDTPVTVNTEAKLDLLFLPEKAPVISGYTPGQIVKIGDILTCTVTGGKPLVKYVTFSCSNPEHQDRDDVTEGNSVSSSVTIDTSNVSKDNDTMTCYCSGYWAPQPDLYTLHANVSFYTDYPAKVENFVLNHTNKTVTVTELEHTNVTLLCEATGRPGPGLLLRKTSHDGTVILNETHVDSENVTHTTLGHDITMADRTDMGNYTCIVWNHVGDNDSTPITLNVNSPPRPASEDPEGKYRNRPFNMTTDHKTVLIDLLVYPVPWPEKFTYTRYANESDRSGVTVSPDRFNSYVTPRGPGNNLVTVNVTGRNVPDVGVYKVTISNDFGRVEFYYAVNEEIHTEDGGDAKKAEVDLTWILVGAGLAFTLIVIIVVVIICRKRRRAGATRKATDNHLLTSSAINNGNTNPAFAGKHMDADNDSGIVENGRSSPEMPNTNVDFKQTPRQSDGAGYASLNEFTPTKQQEGVLREKSARTAAYEVTSITPTGQVSIKQAAPQPNAYQEPWDIQKGDMTLAAAPGGPPTSHNLGPKGDEYAMISNAKNKTTITVGPKGDEYSTVAKHGKGDNTQGSPAKAQGPEDAAATQGSLLSMTSHPLDTPGYATLAQMTPAQGNKGDVTSSSGDATASGSPVQNTSSSGDGTDNFDHFQRDGHDSMSMSQGPDVQYSNIGNY